jgi:3beta-hydroxy-delta5-steroid dehydrogenase/steroid delta-isomerase
VGTSDTNVRKPLDVPLPADLSGPEGEERATTDLGHCLVTGAAGFLGRHLVAELLRRGHRVRGFDCQPLAMSASGLEFVQGDVREMEDVRKAVVGVDTIFHTAAVLDFATFAGREQRERSHQVNVHGVENVVEAAVEAGCQRLVYTSSNNVTLHGPVIDGDETWPYAEAAPDLYTRTKIRGEKTALAANGRGRLLTCAIRPGGIYGPGEQLMVPRLVGELLGGRYLATIGDGTALADNTYIDNLVDGEIEAARHLVPGSPLGGEAYFITDGQPINTFDFFRPIVERLGYRHPRMRVPAGLMLGMTKAWEFLHARIGLPRPPLLTLEVRKIVVSHYSGIGKARRDFGWTPVVSPEEAMDRACEYAKRLVEQTGRGPTES